MDNVADNKYFVFISLKKIIFAVLNANNKLFFKKELLANENIKPQNFILLEKFLDENIISLEKKLKLPIHDISLIIDLNEFITIDITSVQSLNFITNEIDLSSSNLIKIREDVLKNMNDHNLIHMIINKYIINGKEYSYLPKFNSRDDFFLEIRFILLKENTIRHLKKIFSKYEIIVKSISSFDYSNYFQSSNLDNIFETVDRLQNGFNKNEILFIKKTPKNLGFFERFFNLFN